MYPSLEDVAAFIGIVSSIGGAILWLFKKLAIDPLRSSIEALNETIRGLKEDHEKRLVKVEDRVDRLEDDDTRYAEQIKTIFERLPK